MAEDEFLVWEDEEVRFWVAEEEFRVCVAAEEFLVWEDEEARLWLAEDEFLVWVADRESFPELLWTVADDEEPPRDEEDDLRVAVPEEFLCWVELL